MPPRVLRPQHRRRMRELALSLPTRLATPPTSKRNVMLQTPYFTVAQAAAALGISERTLRSRLRRGMIQYQQDQPGAPIRILREDLEEYRSASLRKTRSRRPDSFRQQGKPTFQVGR